MPSEGNWKLSTGLIQQYEQIWTAYCNQGSHRPVVFILESTFRFHHFSVIIQVPGLHVVSVTLGNHPALRSCKYS